LLGWSDRWCLVWFLPASVFGFSHWFLPALVFWFLLLVSPALVSPALGVWFLVLWCWVFLLWCLVSSCWCLVSPTLVLCSDLVTPVGTGSLLFWRLPPSYSGHPLSGCARRRRTLTEKQTVTGCCRGVAGRNRCHGPCRVPKPCRIPIRALWAM